MSGKKRLFWFWAVLFLSGCLKEAPPPAFLVGTNIWPGYECLYLAKGLGYYEGTPIKLVQYPSSSAVIRAFRNNFIQGAALTMDEVLLLADLNQDPKVISILDFSSGGDVVLAKPQFETMNSLKGKRIGVETAALGAFVLSRALETAGMKLSDLEIIRLEPNEHERAFSAGSVDAVVTFDPMRGRLLKAGARVLFDSSQIPGEIVDVLVTRADVGVLHASAVESLLRGWFRALDYLRKNPEEAARRMAPREGITPEELLDSLRLLKIPDLRENISFMTGKDPAFHQGIERLEKILLDGKLIKKTMPPRQLIDPSLLGRIQ